MPQRLSVARCALTVAPLTWSSRARSVEVFGSAVLCRMAVRPLPIRALTGSWSAGLVVPFQTSPSPRGL